MSNYFAQKLKPMSRKDEREFESFHAPFHTIYNALLLSVIVMEFISTSFLLCVPQG